MSMLKRITEINRKEVELKEQIQELDKKTAASIKGGKTCNCSCSCPAHDTDGGKSATTLNTFAS